MNEETIKVAFQGEPGAYSEQALRKYYEGQEIEAGGLAFDSLEEVIRSVEERKATSGIVPVENSVGGYVDNSYKLISQGGVYVTGEVYLRVRHSLLGIEGADLAEIKTVYSHPQALKQCREFLSELGVDTHATYDTAGSAKMVRKKGKREVAAVASRFAGKKYGLSALKEDIQTRENNHTRFLIVSPEPAKKGVEGIDYKTTVTFELGDSPGSLYDCLAPFAKKGINLTMIQSRPTDSGSWEYHFDLELEGHSNEEPARSALEELGSVVPEVQVLGSYPPGDRI